MQFNVDEHNLEDFCRYMDWIREDEPYHSWEKNEKIPDYESSDEQLFFPRAAP